MPPLSLSPAPRCHIADGFVCIAAGDWAVVGALAFPSKTLLGKCASLAPAPSAICSISYGRNRYFVLLYYEKPAWRWQPGNNGGVGFCVLDLFAGFMVRSDRRFTWCNCDSLFATATVYSDKHLQPLRGAHTNYAVYFYVLLPYFYVLLINFVIISLLT